MPALKFTPNFYVAELACHNGEHVPRKYYENAGEICSRAEALRSAIGSPLIVVSGYRSPKYNARIGGAKRSYHMTASALDLVSRTVPASKLRAVYLELIKAGEVPDGGVGSYPNFVHIDIGPARRWSGGHGK